MVTTKIKEKPLSQIKALKRRISELENMLSEREKAKQILIETDRRLQETTQELYMAKEALKREENERLVADQKRMVKQSEEETPAKRKRGPKLTTEEEKKTLKELQIKYNNLMEAHIGGHENETDIIVNELSSSFIQKDISTKKIIRLHLESIKKLFDDVNELESRRKVFSARTVLLMVMTRYASLLRKNK